MDSAVKIPGKYLKIHDYLLQRFPRLEKEIDLYCRQTLPSLAKKGYLLQLITQEFLVAMFDNLQKNGFTADMCFIVTKEWLDRRAERRVLKEFTFPRCIKIKDSDIEDAIRFALSSNPPPNTKNPAAILRYWMGIVMPRFRGYIPGSVVSERLQSVLKMPEKKRFS